MQTAEQCSYTAAQIDGGIWAIEEGFVRAFLVEGDKRALLVDSCNADDDLPGFVRQLTPKPVTVVHTHCDLDHIGASHRFAETRMHPSEFALLRATKKPRFSPRPLYEGERIHLGGRALEVILIPGHTPGSIALLDEKARLLFSGDTVSDAAVFLFGPGRDVPAYINSLERLYGLRRHYSTILPSHGGLPLAPGDIPNMIEGARRLLRGELAGVDDGSGLPCKLYSYKTARFYY